MFDLGFWELMLIGVIALLVVGPERLPGLARTAGHWVARLRRFVQTVKQDIDQELAAERLQKTLSKHAGLEELEELIEETETAVNQPLMQDKQDNSEEKAGDLDNSEEHRSDDGRS